MNPIGIRRAVVLAGLLLPSLAVAQQPPAAPAATPALPPLPQAAASQAATPRLNPATVAAVEQRITALKARLGITAAEEPAWDKFADTMRANAADTDALFAQRTGDAASMTARQNMHSYAAIARSYADDTDRLSTAFDTLYAGLTDAQKQAADALFRQQATEAQKPAPR